MRKFLAILALYLICLNSGADEYQIYLSPEFGIGKIKYSEKGAFFSLNERPVVENNYGTLNFYALYNLDSTPIILLSASNGQNGPTACDPWYHLIVIKPKNEIRTYKLQGACNDIFSATSTEKGPTSILIFKFSKSRKAWSFENGDLRAKE